MTTNAKADTPETIVVMRKGIVYTEDMWQSFGISNELQTNYIFDLWNQDKHITSVAYNGLGWFITASKKTQYTKQAYHYDTNWPLSWINQKYNEGYYITSLSNGNGKWLVVMSQGTNFTSQVYFLRDESIIGQQIKKYWDNGYRITLACPYNGQWFVVMTQDSGYDMQSYAFRNTLEDVKSFIRSKWKENYYITSLTSNGYGNKYFVVMSTNASGKFDDEAYFCDLNPSGNIPNYWNKGFHIVYAGGGCPSTKYTLCNNCNGTGGRICTGCFGRGFIPDIGTCMICHGLTREACLFCFGKGRFTQNIIAGVPNERYLPEKSTANQRRTQPSPPINNYYNPGNSAPSKSNNSQPRVVERTCGVCGGRGKCYSINATASTYSLYCNGSGICGVCNGKKVVNSPYTADLMKCPTCSGSGTCNMCRGTGRCHFCNGAGKHLY